MEKMQEAVLRRPAIPWVGGHRTAIQALLGALGPLLDLTLIDLFVPDENGFDMVRLLTDCARLADNLRSPRIHRKVDSRVDAVRGVH